MSGRLAFVSSTACLHHRTPPGHPEQPARISTLLLHLDDAGLDTYADRLQPRAAEEGALLRVHAAAHVDGLRRACAGGGGMLDEGDTYAVAECRVKGVASLVHTADLEVVGAVARTSRLNALQTLNPQVGG